MRSGMLRIGEDVGRSSRRPQHFFALCKPRVVSLIVFTAVIGMFLAAPGMVAAPRPPENEQAEKPMPAFLNRCCRT